MLSPPEFIAAKRDGGEHAPEEIAAWIDRYARDQLPDYQMAAWAMAVFWRGMTAAETSALTHSMLHSGMVMEWGDGPPVVDKHSTGGIGDKVSLILAPLLACCGLRVPMISGRGLGPTGGTLDKLEAIPGFQSQLSSDTIQRIANECGCVIAGASEQIAPADKRLYGLRDVTGTVPCIPLITASIMSKKLAEGLDALVLDVKWGSGAFMKSLERARAL
ncbi:MAG: thymidine phosphorylase, partial [Planctomycetales bacterium]|nr:thymidine phosphorylase [Planctomycetales bacterium]